MRFLRICSFALSVILSTISLHAATLTIDIEGLDKIQPDNIWNYQLNFNITGEDSGIDVFFNETNQHQWLAAPGVSITNWGLTSNISRKTSQLVIMGENKGTKTTSPLVDGNLFTITYGDQTILDLVLYSFLSEETYTDTIPLFKRLDESTNTLILSTNAVPIPSALLLLGGGILALIGGNRKKTEENNS